MSRNKWNKIKSYDMYGYDGNGFDRKGIHKETGSLYSPDGYDMYGYDENGFNEFGYTREGFSREEIANGEISVLDFGSEYDKEYGFEDGSQIKELFEYINKFTKKPYDRKGFCINAAYYKYVKVVGNEYMDGVEFDDESHQALEEYLRASDSAQFAYRSYQDWKGVEEKDTDMLFNEYGFNRDGINYYGYDERGFNIEDNPRGEKGDFGKKGNHFLTGTDRDPQGYDIRGINERGFYKYSNINVRTKTKYDENGYDKRGFNDDGIHSETHGKYNPDGYDVKGYDKEGYNQKGYNADGYDKEGYNQKGYNADGYNREGYNKLGYDCLGFYKNGIHNATGTKYDEDGYNKRRFNSDGINKDTQDKYDPQGYDVDGYDCLGINKNGINKETGERDERLAFVEEFLGSDKSIEQFAKMKGLSLEKVEEKIQEIRKSPYYASEIDKALKRNSDRYLATIKTLIEKLVAGEISIKEIIGIEEVLRKANNDDREKIFKLLVNQVGTHDTSIMEYAKIFKIKGLDRNLPQNIITKLNEINNSVKYSPDRTIKSKMKDIFKEISRVKAYVAPYIPSEGEKIGFIKPGEKDATMYDITDEERDIARQYLIAKNEFICNKTMQETFKLVVTGEINREIINELTQNSKSARSLAKAVAKDVTVSEAMQGQEFLDLITNEKQIEGDGKDDQN